MEALNGLERFVRRREVKTDPTRYYTLVTSDGKRYLIEDVISKMADELCDLLEWRDQVEGRMDNPDEGP